MGPGKSDEIIQSEKCAMQGQPTVICEAPALALRLERRRKMRQSVASFLAGTAVVLASGVSAPVNAQGAVSAPPAAAAQPTPAQRIMGDIAPKLADITDTVLFGDVWERPGLSKRDRSLITVSALIAMNRPDQLRSHLARARENGMTEQELIEAITHLVAREVFRKK
jgi:4-carboxymuconolactone decarboxylase